MLGSALLNRSCECHPEAWPRISPVKIEIFADLRMTLKLSINRALRLERRMTLTLFDLTAQAENTQRCREACFSSQRRPGVIHGIQRVFR